MIRATRSYGFLLSLRVPATKPHAIVAGQTSVKAPEKEAFEKYLPDDVYIVSVHSLHGPTVTTEGQPLVSDHDAGSISPIKQASNISPS
jgi:prephenate dehydrogenase (NADP+)